MVQNDYVALLDADTINVKHPITKKTIKLYRTIALKSFKLDRYDSVIISELGKLREEFELIQNEIIELQTKQENFNVVINELTLKEEFRRVKELQSELETNSKRLEDLLIQSEDIDLKMTNKRNILDTKTIEKHTIGGYVQSLDNLDPDNPVWVDHRARVFDNAKILHGSLITESCVIYGNAEISSSRVKHYARIHGDSKVIKSMVKDLSEIKGNVKLFNCQLSNSSMVFENADVNNTILETGSCIRGNAVVNNCILKDTAQIQGKSQVTNCKLGGRAVILDGIHENQSFYEDYNLKTESYSE
jgi:carbonic anhydrase/acetyltransferase-like protein (isoleucine patch superfamily)